MQEEEIWRRKLEELTGPSYLQKVSNKDSEVKNSIDLSTLKQPAYTTIKSKWMCAALVLFVVLCLGLWVVAYISSVLPRVTNGVDFRADACGVGQLKGRSLLYFPVILQSTELAICVSQCPGAIASMVCLYDEQGSDYDVVSQSHLCYQTIQCDQQGKYCMPYEPIMSQQLSISLNRPDKAVNRVASDLSNSGTNIVACLLIAILVELIVNIVLARRAMFMKLLGWVLAALNLLLLLALVAVAFLRLSAYQKKYCLGSNDQCQFGNVVTYSTLGYLLAAMTGLLLLMQVCFYKKIYSSPELACVANVLQSTTLNVWVEVGIAVSRIAVTLFFGSAFFMSASDSALVQIQASGIDSNTINTLVFNPIRYWKMGLSLIFFILAVRTLEKIRYFTIATSAMGGSDLDRKQLFKCAILHSGELFITTLLEVLLLPLQIISVTVHWMFDKIGQTSSSGRYFQEHLLFFPFLWLHNNLFRYLLDQTVLFLPYDLTYSERVRLYFLVEAKLHFKHELLEGVKFCSRQTGLFLILLATLLALALTGMQNTLAGSPSSLIENQLVPVAAVFIVCLILVGSNTLSSVPVIEAIFSTHQFLVECDKDEQALAFREKYPDLFTDQTQQPMEVTKVQLNQNISKTEEHLEADKQELVKLD